MKERFEDIKKAPSLNDSLHLHRQGPESNKSESPIFNPLPLHINPGSIKQDLSLDLNERNWNDFKEETFKEIQSQLDQDSWFIKCIFTMITLVSILCILLSYK